MSEVSLTDAASAATVATNGIEAMIFDEFEVGDSLPSEADLAERLGVSRLTIRETVKSLASRGLIVIRNGRRAVVASPSSAHLSDTFTSLIRRNPESLLDLLEVRRAMETHIVAVAARSATATDIGALRAAVAAMRAAQDEAEYREADLLFHGLLGRASHNRMLALLSEALIEPLRLSVSISYLGHISQGENPHDAADQHEELVMWISEGNVKRATAAMEEHLKQAERDLRASLRVASGQSGD